MFIMRCCVLCAVTWAAVLVAADSRPAFVVYESSRYEAEIRALLPADMDLIRCDSGCEQRLSDYDKARVLAVVGQPRDLAMLQPTFPNLRLVQSTHYMHPELDKVPRQFIVAGYNQDWQHDYGKEPIAELVIASIFEWNYRLSTHAEQFRNCAWGDDAPLKCPPTSSMTRHRVLMNLTLGILGYGNIGEAIAIRAAGLGMRVVATRRHGPFAPPPAPLTWLGDDNDRLLHEADFVVTAVPGSVVNIINRTSLALMRNDAVLIPVSAPHVDFDALSDALTKHQIGGAVLDVWPHGCWNYPESMCGSPYGVPAEPYAKHSIEKFDNVIALPGMAMRDDKFWENSASFVVGNLVALASGQPLQGIVRNASSKDAFWL